MSFPIGENHNKWKGENVSYSGLHKWVNKYKGKAFGCTVCGSQRKQRYEWANISGEYKRDLDDFESKCVPCHRKNLKGITPKYTFPKGNTPWNRGKKGLQVAWNKGKKTRLIPKTAYKKGHKAPISAFVIGQEPWNKGLTKINDKRLDYDRPTQFKKGQLSPRKYLQPVICQRCQKQFQPRTITKANKFCSQQCYWISLKLKV